MTDAAAPVWDSLARGRWEEALSLVAEEDDDPEALEAAGVAHWWLDHADEAIAARERAYRLYRDRGDRLGAARVAGALAWDSLLFGGRAAVARGWLDRAARLLRDEPVAAEHAWHAVREAEVELGAGSPEEGREAALRAIAVAAEIGREDIEVVGRSLEGLALVNEGLVEEGMRKLDESAVAAKGGDVRDLMWVGKVCCNLIAACERVGDAERASEWVAEVSEFAQRWELRTLFNICRTQYASVLLQTGAWEEAEAELEGALDVLSAGRRSALFDGMARLGELRRRQGRLDEARSLFARAERSRAARIGQVELALDEGDAERALALAERLDRAAGDERHLDRIAVLPVLVRAAVASGQMETARAAAADLDRIAQRVGTNGARGAAARAAGVVACADGDLDGARRLLEDAVDLLELAETPYERARARLVLARVLRELGAGDAARAEADAALDCFRELDAARDVEFVERFLGVAAAGADSPLTPREREVLAFVAAGRSNREIAEALVVSQHTVHRHVANILRKLGEPTRAAAAARAARDGLV